MSLVAGGLFLTGGIVTAVVALVPNSAAGYFEGWQLVISLFAIANGIGLLATVGRIPPRLFHAIIVGGTAIISLGAWLGGDLAASEAQFYAWVGAFVYTFFTLRQALAYTGLASLSYLLILATSDQSTAPHGRWLYMTATMVATGLVFRWLVDQLWAARNELAELNEHLEALVAEQVVEIERYADDLRESRQRLVTTQDEERRKLERDLHDGAQQQIVALKIRLGLLRSMLEDGDIGEARDGIGVLMGDVDDAVASLRELAHGIYPPLLASDGLARALSARISRSELDVELVDDGVGRCPAEVEAAIYFCCLEALQNVTKYAGAKKVTVQLERHPVGVRFRICDDGVGFDPATASRGHGLTNLQDRLDALAGTLAIASQPGLGTTVEGTIPLSDDRQPQPA